MSSEGNAERRGSETARAMGAADGVRPEPNGGAAPSRRWRQRVLVVEDHVDTAESLCLLLELSGRAVRSADHGAAAVALARVFVPHVVLCDIGLPGDMDGFAVARALRDSPTPRSPFLVALSGLDSEDAHRRARECGFDSLLAKPLDFEVLRALLDGLPAR